MADNPSTSLTISFSTKVTDEDGNVIDDAQISAEVNSEDNGGKTSFNFGDSVYFRVYKSANINQLFVFTTDGSEAEESSNNIGLIEDEIVTFSNSNEASTSKPIVSLVSATPLGNSNLGSITQNGSNGVKCSKTSGGDFDPLVGVYKITYQTKYHKRRLYNVSPPSGFGEGDFTSYPVLIYILGIAS